MSPLTLKAHFDGTHITLDEPFDLQPDMQLAVVVFPTADDRERAEWGKNAAAGLARAYSESEPEYTPEDIKS